MHVAASRVESVRDAEAAADKAMNADATEVEAYVTIIAEASTTLKLTLVRAAAAPSASRTRVDSVMTAEAAADNSLNPDATEAEKKVTAAAEARTALTLVQAAAAPSRFNSVMAAEALAAQGNEC